MAINDMVKVHVMDPMIVAMIVMMLDTHEIVIDIILIGDRMDTLMVIEWEVEAHIKEWVIMIEISGRWMKAIGT